MSLRTKQALILLLATVLPFAIGGAAMNLVVAPAYRRVVSRSAAEVTAHLASHVGWSLERYVAVLQRAAAWDRLRAAARASRLDGTGAADLDRRWEQLPTDSAPVRARLENPAAWELWRWQQTDPAILEVLAADAHGSLVAASRKPSHFIQSDEAWWSQAYDGGRGRVYLSEVLFDPSSSAWGIAVAVPIRAADAADSPAIGVLKVVLDTAQVFQDVKRAGSPAGEVFLIDRRGRVVAARQNQRPLARALLQPKPPALREDPTGSAVSEEEGDRLLIAWARVPFRGSADLRSARTPDLYVVSRRDAAEALGPLRTVQAWMLAIGALTIAVATGLGYWLTDLLVVRSIRKLAAGMRDLARGDFDRAAAVADELTRRQ